MTDYSDCMEGLPYIIKNNGSGTDTIFSYVDHGHKVATEATEPRLRAFCKIDEVEDRDGIYCCPSRFTFTADKTAAARSDYNLRGSLRRLWENS